MSKSITFVLTSCGRWDLLEKTLDSFLECNTYPIKKYIIVEDSGNVEIRDKIKSKYPFVKLIFHEKNKGQLFSIDEAYSLVKTPYVFQNEDDWFFDRKGDFIGESIKILEKNSKLLQVWIRHEYDNPHKSNPDGSIPDWCGWKSGFSFNPGVRRIKEYRMASPYSTRFLHEKQISDFYAELGYSSFLLKETCCYHIGYDRSLYTR